jgi:hypothetical protein
LDYLRSGIYKEHHHHTGRVKSLQARGIHDNYTVHIGKVYIHGTTPHRQGEEPTDRGHT